MSTRTRQVFEALKESPAKGETIEGNMVKHAQNDMANIAAHAPSRRARASWAADRPPQGSARRDRQRAEAPGGPRCGRPRQCPQPGQRI